MKRALYLRPGNLDLTGLDDALKAWLRGEGFEPVDAAPYELVAYLPYDGGGNYYHADVSPRMASVLVANIAEGVEVRGIHLKDTETCWAGEADRDCDYLELEAADLAWDDTHHGGRPTISIMTPAEVEEAERIISREGKLGWHDLGAVWVPPSPRPARAPSMPVLRASVSKVTYGFTARRGEAVSFSILSEPEPHPCLPDAILLKFARAAAAAGVWAPPAGVPVEEALDLFAAGMRFNLEGDAFISGEADVEEVTIHPDGTHTTRPSIS